jgi:hypothetical protein
MEDFSSASDQVSQSEAEPVRTGRWAGRRLTDAINEAFQLALTRGHLRTAMELLAVMEHYSERAKTSARFDNRHADSLLELGRRDLQSAIKAQRRRQELKAAQLSEIT